MSFKCKIGIHSWDGYKCTQCGKEKSYFSLLLPVGDQECKCAKIGKQIWMSVNLDVSNFRNGDKISEARTDEEWLQAGDKGKPVWCHYNNDIANGKPYGKLYNWYAVTDPRDLAPNGWHVPSDHEWEILTDFLGGFEKAAFKMKSTSGWVESPTGLTIDKSKFTGTPGGYRESEAGMFSKIGEFGTWWSTTAGDAKKAYSRIMMHDNPMVWRFQIEKSSCLSVRCVKD